MEKLNRVLPGVCFEMDTKTSVGIVPIFCINLARRSDRWENFGAQRGIQGLGPDVVKRWDAVDGAALDYMNDARVGFRTRRNILKKLRRAWEDIYTPGALGCYLSHVGIWEWLAQSDSQACVVLEDDCKVPDDFAAKLRGLWEESAVIQNGRYDICVLHRRAGKVAAAASVAAGAAGGTGSLGGDERIEPMESFYNTTGYIITRNCARRLLAHAFPIQVHVDRYIGLYKNIHGLQVFRVREGWLNITSSGSLSDIDRDYCYFCDIPSDFNQKYKAMGMTDFIVGRLAQITGVILLASWVMGGVRF